jgi:hypothetical protein
VSALASVIDVVQLAHETGFPHQDPVPVKSSGGGASTVVILIGIVVSLVAVGGLIWLKRRTDA